MDVPDHTQYPSRHALDDVVLFQPDLCRKLDDTTNAVPAKVVGISFVPGKVLYDLALVDVDGFYTELPIRAVDSIMVHPAPHS